MHTSVCTELGTFQLHFLLKLVTMAWRLVSHNDRDQNKQSPTTRHHSGLDKHVSLEIVSQTVSEIIVVLVWNIRVSQSCPEMVARRVLPATCSWVLGSIIVVSLCCCGSAASMKQTGWTSRAPTGWQRATSEVKKSGKSTSFVAAIKSLGSISGVFLTQFGEVIIVSPDPCTTHARRNLLPLKPSVNWVRHERLLFGF